MKGGLAVMIELARWAAEADLAYDLALLFFPREELGPRREPAARALRGDAASSTRRRSSMCLEPTDNTLQLGCLGNLTARLVFEGRSAHSARPWLGVNAIGLAVDGLREVVELEPRDVQVEGLSFREVHLRHADPRRRRCQRDPGARRGDAELPLRAGAHAGRRGGMPARHRRARTSRSFRTRPLRTFRRSSRPSSRVSGATGAFEIEPKQAWTNVADFAARGLDAVNLGPGATRFAHAVDEQVEIAELERTFEALQRFLLGAASGAYRGRSARTV